MNSDCLEKCKNVFCCGKRLKNQISKKYLNFPIIKGKSKQNSTNSSELLAVPVSCLFRAAFAWAM